MQEAIRTHGDRPCAGRRPLLRRHYEEVGGRPAEKLELGAEYEWTSFSAYGARMDAVGKGLLLPQEAAVLEPLPSRLGCL